MALIAKADLETRVGVAEVARYARSIDANITAAIAQSEDKAKSAALNVFSSDSWAAMTSATLPAEAKYHIVSDACDILSAGTDGRPEMIGAKADEARQWRSWLAAGKVGCFEGVLTRTEDDEAVTWNAGATITNRTFDRLNTDSGYAARNEKI